MQFSNQLHKTVKFHRTVQPLRSKQRIIGIKTTCGGHSDVLGYEEQRELYVGVGVTTHIRGMARFNFTFTALSYSSVSLYVGREQI